MKIFISQPMRDKTDAQIQAARNKVIERVKELFPSQSIEVIDSFFEGAPHDAKPLWFLGESIKLLANADLAVFIGEWSKYRGCLMEHTACDLYQIPYDTFEDIA